MIATVTKKAVTARSLFGRDVTLTKGMELDLTEVMESSEISPNELGQPRKVYTARIPGTDDTVKMTSRQLGQWCVCRSAKDLGYE